MRALAVLLALSGLLAVPERTMGPLRVASADPGARLVTFADSGGVIRVLPVRRQAEKMLPRLRPDDLVVLTLGPEPGVPRDSEVVLRIDIVGVVSQEARRAGLPYAQIRAVLERHEIAL
jgi:hypothetical protein